MPEIPELPDAWKLLYWPLLMTQPEAVRKRLLGELDEIKNADTAADPILELEQRRRGGAGPQARPVRILNAPSVAPEAPNETSDTDDYGNKFCHDRWEREMNRCRKKFPGVRACTEMASHRRNLCVGNNGRPRLDEPEQWGND